MLTDHTIGAVSGQTNSKEKLIIYCKDRHGNKTIYKTNKVKLIDNTMYFISEGELNFMSDKQQEPMYIDFPDNEAADYAERRSMTGKEKFEYLTKFSL